MGLGSENKEQRQKFIKVVRADWKARVLEENDARRIISMFKSNPLHTLDEYTMRKIRELETYIRCKEPNEGLKDFQKRVK